MDFAGSWGQDITVQTAPSEPLIESNPFTNGTHLLIKWKTSMCENQVIYYYDLSGDGLVLQGNTTETEVVFGEGIESSKEYTFTVLASYLNVNGTSENTKVMFESDCDQMKGYIIGFVIGPVITVAITLIYKRFRRKH
ncbi:uncharacterized protein [Antedon mediterranea]|uniref:uncharacterized protein n=1 Tax=Antedon mediterranea TaxID=105859 RepID=UPI003AF4A4B8